MRDATVQWEWDEFLQFASQHDEDVPDLHQVLEEEEKSRLAEFWSYWKQSHFHFVFRLTQQERDAFTSLWDSLKTGNHHYGHDEDVRSVTFSNDGKTLISGDANGVINVWQLP